MFGKRVVSLLLAALLLVVSPVSALASETESCEVGDLAEAEIIEEEPEAVEEELVEDAALSEETNYIEAEEPAEGDDEVVETESCETGDFADATEEEVVEEVSEDAEEQIEALISGEGWTFDGDTGTLTIWDNVGCPFERDWDNLNTTVKSIVFSEGVTEIFDCGLCANLTSITFPSTAKVIGEGAFVGCKSLKSVTIPDGYTTIEEDAFSDCEALVDVTIPKSVTSISQKAFWGCGDVAFSGYAGSVAETYAKKYAISFKVIGNLPAKYYRIQFVGNGAKSGSMDVQDCKINGTYLLKGNMYERPGYSFAGWNTKKSGSGKSYRNVASVKNLTKKSGATVKLYAQWKANKYNIKFNANGGKGSMKKLSVTYGKSKTLSANKFKKKGYKFKGWATSKKDAKKGIVKYKNKKKVKNLTTKNKGTVTLYAVWGK